MGHEVVVVGGGIGGLTVAALLAARGMDVCVLERQSQVGGCVASFEKFGFQFEPAFGLYTGWGRGEIHQQIFSELPVRPPETRTVNPAFFVRRRDGVDVAVGSGMEQVALPATAFSECCASVSNLAGQEVVGIRGGAGALAERLAESIKHSGGSVRLNSPVLRLSYDSQGKATGVDLLTAENISASRAIVSNMTVWDTYGKLIGLQRTPPEIKKRLAALQTSGVYLIFAALNDTAAKRLPADHLLVATDQLAEEDSLIDVSGFAFASAPNWDTRGVDNKRAATISFRADVDQWFTYQVDLSEQEEKDQAALEIAWGLVHKHIPELQSDIEVIETATPQTFYDTTRRKLGMVGTPTASPYLSYRTSLPNVFMVGDTVSPVASVASISQTALALANELSGK